MKEFLQRIEKLSPSHLALLAVDQQKRLEKLERSLREPVAIVGIGCRFPGGADGPEAFWDLLANRRDGIGEVPSDRWDVDALFDPDPDVPGRVSTRFGGFLRDVDQFDAAFFGISRREANSMDPQQRLLLETTWEALEHAGVSPRGLSGSPVGIYFGLSTADYHHLLLQGGREAIDGYTATGCAHSVAAGRIAYLLGLHGPNLAVDTACSSSLVALHLACQSLRAGECELALAGGVNLILSPETSIALSRAHMLAPDGRCKAFDASADGFVRSEGCGVVALKLLSRAVADRDNIIAVIRGSAINQDGRSHGLTAPNGAAQEKVLRHALQAAGVKASAIQYVEAHGTGTSLGDPIEAHALAAVLGNDRGPNNPLYVGSVKTNIGHLESAAGIAGVIKTALSLQRGIIPANLHFSRLNPHIDLHGAPLLVPVDPTPWTTTDSRMAGVSSFGFSGTNVHIVMEQPPECSRLAGESTAAHTIDISARTPQALRTLARHYAAWLQTHPEVSLQDFCYTVETGRSRFEQVQSLTAASTVELREKLAAVADGIEMPDAVTLPPTSSGTRIPLPTYPFERQRYWLEANPPQNQPESATADLDIYAVEWEPKPVHHPEPSVSAGITATGSALTPRFGELSREHGLDRFAELSSYMDRLSGEFIVRALSEMAWQPAPGDEVTVEGLAAALGVLPRYWRSFGRMLEIVAEDGALERRGDSWTVRRLPVATDPACEFPLLQAAYPEFRGELTFLLRCGKELAQALQGRVDPLNLLFPDGSFETAEDLYENSAGAQVFQRLIQESVTRAVEQFPAGRTLRILEIGAGTGGTATYVARTLDPARTEYVFTDVSPLFAARAVDKFRQYPFFRYEVLDIERDPESQGFAPHSFDIVIASNSLHATTDLRRSVNHALQLLVPDGLLLLLEGTRSERWVDVTFGLTQGWWKFVDLDLRSKYPLLSRAGWLGLLSAAGCQEITTVPPDPTSQQVLLLARGPGAVRMSQGWAIVAKPGNIGPLISAVLSAHGHRSIILEPGSPLPAGDGFHGVVDLSGLDTPIPENLDGPGWADAQRFGCERLLAMTRQLRGRGTRLWVVTRGAQAVSAEDRISPLAAPVWGLGRSIALEQPDLWGGLIDLDPQASAEEQAELLVSELLADDGEDQVAFRAGTRRVARLRKSPHPPSRDFRLHADGCYLITGGLGGLGLLVARWMAQQGARRLILVGRNGITRDTQSATLREVEALGATFRIVQADIADPAQTESLFTTLASEEPPLRGVIHTAAVLSRDTLFDVTPVSLRAILLPKIAGTWLLHQHTRHLPLDFFCLFSSTASVLGSGGLAHYTAANQFLDAFAHYRRRLGLPAVSIEWGTWDEMRTASSESRQQYKSIGLSPMASSQALACLGDLLESPQPVVMAAAINWRTLKAVFEARRKRPLLDSIAAAAPEHPVKPAPSPDGVPWETLSASDRENRMRALVWEETCRVLRIPAGTPQDLDRGFFEMGMDSLVSVELKSRLEGRLGRTLPSMMTFNFPNLRALSKRLGAEFTASEAAPPPPSLEIADDDEIAQLLARKLQQIQRKGALNLI